MDIKSNFELFVKNSKNKFGDRFEYDESSYKNTKTKTHIFCKKHQYWFSQKPSNHLMGNGGCPLCKKEIVSQKASERCTMGNQEFIRKAQKIHNDKYIYTDVDMLHRNEKGQVCIICQEHGAFWQNPQDHLNGKGCKLCGYKYRKHRELTVTTDDLVQRFKQVHGELYDYSLVNYKGKKETVDIICKKHGVFPQLPYDHLMGHGCPKCGFVESKAEAEIYEKLKSFHISTILVRNKEILDGQELDLFMPEKNLAIEYNGLHWHTEEFGRDRHYHLDKLNRCNEKGIQLIQIFEDEWLEHKDIVLSKIAHTLKLGKPEKVVYGRKCKIEEISLLSAKPFFEQNHIQGFGRGSVILGAIYEDELVGACIFKKEDDEDNWELTRMATKDSYLCNGVCGKMFKHFTKHYNPSCVKSFADRRWTLNSNNNVYTKLGFALVETLQPDYRYVVGNQRVHKFNLRKDRLHAKFGLPLTMTEKEMCNQLGYKRIWDCGLFKYVWNANDNNTKKCK